VAWVIDHAKAARKREVINLLAFTANDLRALLASTIDLRAEVEHSTTGSHRANWVIAPFHYAISTLTDSLRATEEALATGQDINVLVWEEADDGL